MEENEERKGEKACLPNPSFNPNRGNVGHSRQRLAGLISLRMLCGAGTAAAVLGGACMHWGVGVCVVLSDSGVDGLAFLMPGSIISAPA